MTSIRRILAPERASLLAEFGAPDVRTLVLRGTCGGASLVTNNGLGDPAAFSWGATGHAWWPAISDL